MKDRRLAVSYARALVSVLVRRDESEAADRFLAALAQEMEVSPDFRRFLLDPAVSREQRSELLGRLVRGAGQTPAMARFLDMLVEHRRLAALPSISIVFHELRERAQGIVTAEVTTAEALGEDLRTRARSALGRLTGQEVRVQFEVDPTLLGGVITRVGSRIYDGSLRSQLEELRRAMAQE